MLLRLLPLLILFASCERPADLPRPISDSIAIGLVAHYTLDGSPKDLTGNNPDLVVGNTTVKASERPNKSSENAMYFTGRSNSYAGMNLSSSVLSVNVLIAIKPITFTFFKLSNISSFNNAFRAFGLMPDFVLSSAIWT